MSEKAAEREVWKFMLLATEPVFMMMTIAVSSVSSVAIHNIFAASFLEGRIILFFRNPAAFSYTINKRTSLTET